VVVSFEDKDDEDGQGGGGALVIAPQQVGKDKDRARKMQPLLSPFPLSRL
jgi:hypothetical protein